MEHIVRDSGDLLSTYKNMVSFFICCVCPVPHLFHFTAQCKPVKVHCCFYSTEADNTGGAHYNAFVATLTHYLKAFLTNPAQGGVYTLPAADSLCAYLARTDLRHVLEIRE